MGRQLLGIISDGDLRRLLERRGKDALDLTAGECMKREPKPFGRKNLPPLHSRAWKRRKITSLAVVDATGNLHGIIHLHDLWGTEMV